MSITPWNGAKASWVDNDLDGYNDTWVDPSSNIATSIADLNAINQDIDGDNATNEEELQYGSNPSDLDSDDDGLDDGTEIHQAILIAGKSYSLTNWDSNGDGVSDHDDFYGSSSVTYPNGSLPNFPNASYFDYDGDGTKNPFDLYPTDPLNDDNDQDGIKNGNDPMPESAENVSPSNGESWWGNALGDADSDLIYNFWDSFPYDGTNGSGDSDSDGIANSNDPFPQDNSNYSPTNSTYWYSDVFGDADGDGIANHSDAWPYSGYNGDNDVDDDGIDNDLDPLPTDPTNYSAENNTSWYGYALEDQDNDGSTNFNDPYPTDTFNGIPDFDGDGWINIDDPFPKDSSNYSSLNQTAWWTDLFSDPDSDGLANWQDEFPSDTFNGLPDFDNDGINNEPDPYPKDSWNYSSINGVSWGTNVLDDADSDGTPNWNDSNPYPVPDIDSDDDGIDDAQDPYPNDASNYSPTNGTFWYSNVLGNSDGDSLLNWEDAWPSDPNNGTNLDRDSDGILNDADPAPDDSSNYSSYNWNYWYSSALSDADNDGTLNFWDYQPYQSPDVDSDSDGYLDSIDPAVNDPSNWSYINGTWWNSSALNDHDTDGTSNFYDSTPYGDPPPADNDQDGLNVDEEWSWGTSDNDGDSDDDGLSDGEEVEVYSTSPTNKYFLSQQIFSSSLYTDYQLVDLTDSDSDQIPDRIEQYYNLSPSDPRDALWDLDDNGINNRTQYAMGISLDAELNLYDQDMDGMSDVFEDFYQLAKTYAGDAVTDADGDGVLNYEERKLLLSPQNPDTYEAGGLGDMMVLLLSMKYPDGGEPIEDISPANGVPDWVDEALAGRSAPEYFCFTRMQPDDLDDDGMFDAWEYQYGRHKHPQNGLLLRFSDSFDDNDEDGLINLYEQQIGTSPIAGDSDGNTVGDANEDFDSDGMTNLHEYHFGTNALNRDSDGDGVDDGTEFREGTDAKNAQSNSSALIGLSFRSHIE